MGKVRGIERGVPAVSLQSDGDADIRAILETLDPKARDDLRRVLIRDQADRDAISSRLMRYRDQNGQNWADIIDFLTMYPEARRSVVRLLGELEASEGHGRKAQWFERELKSLGALGNGTGKECPHQLDVRDPAAVRRAHEPQAAKHAHISRKGLCRLALVLAGYSWREGHEVRPANRMI
jgi:hypothetical protein